MKTVSIIVPVYNVSQYIERCWASLNCQTYPGIELIFVDDCGTDDSIPKLEELISLGHNFPVRIIRHNKNRGLSAARNSGYKVSSGEYVYFLDSDDDISPTCIEDLVLPTEKNAYDFIVGNYSVNGNVLHSLPPLSPGEILGNERIMASFSREWFGYVMAWNKLVKKSFLEENHISFKEGIIHEDILWSFCVSSRAESMYVVTKQTYNYNIRKNSIMTSLTIKRDLNAYLVVFDAISDYIREQGCFKNRYQYSYYTGKRAGILYSLLQKGEYALYRKAYDYLRSQYILSPYLAFGKGFISFPYLVRDLHYAMPASIGRIYFFLFYLFYYKLRSKQIEGAVW